MKCKSLLILLGVLIGLFPNYALASDDSPDAVGDVREARRVVVIPLDLGGQKRELHVYTPSWDTDVYIGHPPQTVHGHSNPDASGVFISSDSGDTIGGHCGGTLFLVRKMTGKTWHITVDSDDSLALTETDVASSIKILPGGDVVVKGYVRAQGFITEAPPASQKESEKLWRMFEDETGLYLENLRTGKVYSFVLREVERK